MTGLRPEAAGIYYQGVVIAIGLGAILRKKYEFFLAPFITGNLQRSFGIPVSKVVYRLGRSLLIRSSVVCCILLVITADLDILEPRLQPYLETFLPFVLAIPFVALGTMCAILMRAANCLVLSVIGATLAVNVAVIGAALIGTALATDGDATLLLYSWAYFVGSLASAGLSALFLRRVLRRWEVPGMATDCAAWARVHREVASTGGASVAHSFVLWGPPCLLALFASAPEFASFAAAVRSSQVVEFLLPSLSFLKCTESNAIPWLERQCTDRAAFLRVLGASTMASTIIVAGPDDGRSDRVSPLRHGLRRSIGAVRGHVGGAMDERRRSAGPSLSRGKLGSHVGAPNSGDIGGCRPDGMRHRARAVRRDGSGGGVGRRLGIAQRADHASGSGADRQNALQRSCGRPALVAPCLMAGCRFLQDAAAQGLIERDQILQPSQPDAHQPLLRAIERAFRVQHGQVAVDAVAKA